MKKLILVTLCSASFVCINAQDPKKLLKEAMDLAKEQKYQESMPLFNQAIDISPGDYYAHFNRGVVKLKMDYCEDAIKDFNQALMLSPKYKKVYLIRAEAKMHCTDYDGAIADYTLAIKEDPTTNAQAYFERGNVNQLLNKTDSACSDFAKAAQLNNKEAKKKLDKCRETTLSGLTIHPILKLTIPAEDDKYGFTSDNPIKTGTGYDGGPANMEAYIKLLRDVKGLPIYFQRLGPCCQYASPNGFDGKGVLEKYRIVYQTAKGKDKESIIYFTLYDYEEPKILFGFTSVIAPK